MKLLLALALLSPSAFAAAPLAQRCQLTGDSLWNAKQYQEILLDQVTREIAFVLSEDAGSGAFNTYAHVEIGVHGVHWARTQLGKAKAIESDPANRTNARITFASRVQGKDPVVNLRCEAFPALYLFRPTTGANHDPFSGAQYIPTTVANLLANPENFYTSVSPSLGEYLAKGFCVTGDAQAAASEIALNPALWRRDAKSGDALSPLALKSDENGISWQQRRQSLECVRSHEEKVIDEDSGEERTVVVCDETKLNELDPALTVIRACK